MSKTFGQFIRYVNTYNLPKDAEKGWINYGLHTFNKTRFSSHTSFLRRCLKDKIIPKGFQLQFHCGSTSNHLSFTNKSSMEKCSFQLMRNVLKENDYKIKNITTVRLNLKNFLRLQSERLIWINLSTRLHQLNVELYHTFRGTKDNKLSHIAPSEETKSTNNFVVKIPDSIMLSIAEKSVLEKGLSFIPHARTVDSFQTLEDAQRLYRKIRLKAHFSNCDETKDNIDDQNEFVIKAYNKKPSTYTPRQGEFEAVDNYISTCQKQIKTINLSNRVQPTNISKEEIDALNRLKSRQDIVIKPADKGGAVCVWAKDLYIKEGEQQLSDIKFYKPLDNDKTENIQKLIVKEINSMITNKQLPESAKNLIVKTPRCARFFLLPKIHKKENPGRPVISNISCPTYFISKFLSDELRPLVEECPSYIKDTTHLLQKLDNFRFLSISEKNRLFTMDVKGLYTNIPNKDGLLALKHFLDRRKEKHISTTTMLRLAELVLTSNSFEFNGKYYSQKGGTMMGTPFGVEYACIYMSDEEEKIDNEYVDEKPLALFRYIDDIFGISSMTEDKLKKFLDFVSTHQPALQYTAEISTRVNMLDTTLSVRGDRIESTLFSKPTDTHSYLRFDSSHPITCKRGIPYSQFMRVRRICSSDDDFAVKSIEMKKHLLRQNYPARLVEKARQRVLCMKRNDVLYNTHDASEKNSKRLVFPIVYQLSVWQYVMS